MVDKLPQESKLTIGDNGLEIKISPEHLLELRKFALRVIIPYLSAVLGVQLLVRSL